MNLGIPPLPVFVRCSPIDVTVNILSSLQSRLGHGPDLMACPLATAPDRLPRDQHTPEPGIHSLG